MKKFCVNVDNNEALGRLLQEKAFEAGCKWYSGDKTVLYPDSLQYLHFEEDKYLTKCSIAMYELYTVQQALKYLESVYAEKHLPITIGDYEVIFTKFGLKIGCKSVSYEQAKALYELMEELSITNFYIEHQNVNFTTVKEIYNRI